MSAFAKQEVTLRPSRVGIRDGKIVRLKVCTGPCGQEKICTLGPDSDFHRSGTTPKGTLRWKSRCKVCTQLALEEYRKVHGDRTRELARVAYKRQIADPAYAEKRRASWREVKRKAAQDFAKRERKAAQDRRWKSERRKRERDKVNEDWRLWYAMRRERDGLPYSPQTKVIEGTRPRLSIAPFRAWLRAYQEETGYSVPELAMELDLVERQVLRFIGDEGEQVSLDVVCRALMNANRFVSVDDNLVVTLDDLYREGNS